MRNIGGVVRSHPDVGIDKDHFAGGSIRDLLSVRISRAVGRDGAASISSRPVASQSSNPASPPTGEGVEVDSSGQFR
jgi:hypothetical protein